MSTPFSMEEIEIQRRLSLERSSGTRHQGDATNESSQHEQPWSWPEQQQSLLENNASASKALSTEVILHSLVISSSVRAVQGVIASLSTEPTSPIGLGAEEPNLSVNIHIARVGVRSLELK